MVLISLSTQPTSRCPLDVDVSEKMSDYQLGLMIEEFYTKLFSVVQSIIGHIHVFLARYCLKTFFSFSHIIFIFKSYIVAYLHTTN